jgi:4-amino-4-deoxychorismate lyase
MSLLVESIKIFNGKVYNIAGHEKRANLARLQLFACIDPLNIRKNINIPAEFSTGLVKCRVIYDDLIRDIQYHHYTPRNIKTLKVLDGRDTQYAYKYLKRDDLDVLYNKRNGCDEIIIVNNGLVADAYYYNIVCCNKNSFFTPRMPLLNGVQRQKLITSGRIEEIDIHIAEVCNFESIHLINAFTPLGKIVIPTNQIKY